CSACKSLDWRRERDSNPRHRFRCSGFKTVHGWEEHRVLPIYTNKTGPSQGPASALIGARRHHDTDKKRTVAPCQKSLGDEQPFQAADGGLSNPPRLGMGRTSTPYRRI